MILYYYAKVKLTICTYHALHPLLSVRPIQFIHTRTVRAAQHYRLKQTQIQTMRLLYVYVCTCMSLYVTPKVPKNG